MMPTLETTVTVHKTITISPALKRKMLADFRLFQQLDLQIKELEDAKAKVKESLAVSRESTGEKVLELEGFKTQYIEPTRSELDKKLLIAQGVSTAQIENATVTRSTKAYEKVTVPHSPKSSE